MELIDDMTPEEIVEAAKEGRAMFSRLTGKEVPDTCPVVYEKRTVMVKIGGNWWCMVHGEETSTSEHALTMIPLTVLFAHMNDMMAYVAKIDGEDALGSLLGIEIVREDGVTGEDSPTLN
jgi:predicted ATP-grasp superfamily ATP-dependent carboligase